AAGVDLPAGAQDQLLMEALASALRRIRAESLADDFITRLARTEADVVINDDLRDPHVDAVALREQGFYVVRVHAPAPVRQARLAARGDVTVSDRSTEGLDQIQADAVIENCSDLASFRSAVRRLV